MPHASDNLIVALLPGGDLDALCRTVDQARAAGQTVDVYPFDRHATVRQRLHGDSVTVHYPQTLLERTIDRHVDEYLDCLRQIPGQAPDLLHPKHWGDYPLWWSCELREANLMVWPAMLQVFRLIAIRDLVREADAACHLIAGTQAECQVLRSALGGQLRSAHAARSHQVGKWRLFASRLLGFTRFARIVMAARKHRRSAPSTDCLILSFAYNLQTFGDQQQDKYYRDLPPDLAHTTPTTHTTSLVGHQLGFSPDRARSLLEKLPDPDGTPEHPYILEASLGLLDVIASYWRPDRLLAEWRYDQRLPAVSIAGLDVTPIFRDELRRVIASAPWRRLSGVALHKHLVHSQVRTIANYIYEYGLGRLLTHVARQHGLQPIGIQHGPCGPRDTLMRFAAADLDAGMPYPTHVIVDGHEQKRLHCRDGIPIGQVTACGACRFDDRTIKPQRPLPQDRPLRMLLASSLHDTIPTTDLVQASGVWQEHDILLKAHPKLAISNDRLARKYPELQLTTTPVSELFSQVDLVISTYSSVGIEALIEGLPVICIVPEGLPPMAPWGEQAPFAPTVRTPDEMQNAIDQLTRTNADDIVQARDDFIHGIFGPLDGQASQRAARVIAEHTP